MTFDTCWIGRTNVLGRVTFVSGLAVMQAFGTFLDITTNQDPGIAYGRFTVFPVGALIDGSQILFDVIAGNFAQAVATNIRFQG